MLGATSLLLLPYFKLGNSNYDSMHTIGNCVRYLIKCMLMMRSNTAASSTYEAEVNSRQLRDSSQPHHFSDLAAAQARLDQLWDQQVCHSMMRDGGQWLHMLDKQGWLKNHDWYFLCKPFTR
jgi:hypothetical protein